MQSVKIQKIMIMLGALAEQAPKVANVQMASAIVYRHDIISVGIAEKKTHPLQNKYKKCKDSIFLHSEINSLRKALRILTLEELAKSTLLIARVKKYGDKEPHRLGWGLAKPCSGCMSAIEAFHLERVYYTLDSMELTWEELARSS